MSRPWHGVPPVGWLDVLDEALDEDLGRGDASAALVPEDLFLDWVIEAQADGVICGIGIAVELFEPEDGERIETCIDDSETVARSQPVMRGTTRARRLLSHERTALNFLMHLSGVATLTRLFVQAAADHPAQITDTRKTVPGLRALQKYAVRCGGGRNHRLGLDDGVMVKDNHLRALGGIAPAIAAARAAGGYLLKVEVECATLEQVDEAVAAGADVVMLDNMSHEEMTVAVARNQGLAVFEASGGVTIDTVAAIAATGVDFISVGALTHSSPALNLHLDVL